MALNGDAVNQDAQQKLARVSGKIFEIFRAAVEKTINMGNASLQAWNKSREKQKLLESYGITREFEKYLKDGGRMRSIDVHQKDYLDFAREMKKVNVPFLTSTIAGDDCLCVRFRETDAERVEMAIESLKRSRMKETEMSVEDFTRANVASNIFSVEGITLVELELIRHFAERYGFQFAAEATLDDDNCKVYFCDKNKMDQILKDVAWQLTGERGPLVKEQIEYRIAGRTKSHELLTAQDLVKEYYIVSKVQPDHFLQISSDDIQLYKDGKMVTSIARGSEGAYERTIAAQAGIKEPVILEKEEWESRERQAIIETRQQIGALGVPATEGLIQEARERERKALEVYNLKLSLDNSYSLQFNNSLTDETVSYVQFYEIECVNDRFEEGIQHAASASEYLANKKLQVKEEQNIEKEATISYEAERNANREYVPYGKDSRSF